VCINFFLLSLITNLRYELMSVCRCYQELLYPLLFLLIAIVLFHLGSHADSDAIKKIAPGIFWIIVLFLQVLMLEHLFRDDWQEGDLEQLIVNSTSLLLPIFVKLIAFCLLICIPLTIMTPLLALALSIPACSLKTLFCSIWLGVPTLVFLGGIARVLTLGLRHGSLLIILLVMPFYIPVLIFASNAVEFSSIGLPPNAALTWLCIFMVLSTSFAPFFISGILRLGIISW
jgi:heme exporter protein B